MMFNRSSVNGVAGLFGGDSLHVPCTLKTKRGFNTLQRIKFCSYFTSDVLFQSVLSCFL